MNAPDEVESNPSFRQGQKECFVDPNAKAEKLRDAQSEARNLRRNYERLRKFRHRPYETSMIDRDDLRRLFGGSVCAG